MKSDAWVELFNLIQDLDVSLLGEMVGDGDMVDDLLFVVPRLRPLRHCQTGTRVPMSSSSSEAVG